MQMHQSTQYTVVSGYIISITITSDNSSSHDFCKGDQCNLFSSIFKAPKPIFTSVFVLQQVLGVGIIAGQVKQQWTAHQRFDEPIQFKNIKLQNHITQNELQLH